MAPAHKILPLTQQDLNSYLGRYKYDQYGFIKVYKENGKLMAVQNLNDPTELIKVGENTFAMRDWNFKVSFVQDTISGKKELIQTLADQTIRSKNPKLVKDEIVPLELILEGHFERGLQAYQKAKKEDSNHEQLSEGFLNSMGYVLLHRNKTDQAIDLFRVNTHLYPNSENAYDSLGEAYLKAGNKNKAKQSYQQLIKINPKNERAIQVLQTL